jgi:hypothetical protein
MYFDEGRQLNHLHGSEFETSSRIGSARQQPDNSMYDDVKEGGPLFAKVPRQPPSALRTGGALDAANNKLQELMQLFYLLSRDPAIPQDARYHVTVAQSEIALLTRLMQNIANATGGENQPSARRDAFTVGDL